MLKLKELRKQKSNYTQKQMADLLGISTQAYSTYEVGKNSPNIYTLLKISKILGCTMEELMGESTPSGSSDNSSENQSKIDIEHEDEHEDDIITVQGRKFRRVYKPHYGVYQDRRGNTILRFSPRVFSKGGNVIVNPEKNIVKRKVVAKKTKV